MKLRRDTPGKANWKIDCEQLMNPAIWREYKSIAEKNEGNHKKTL